MTWAVVRAVAPFIAVVILLAYIYNEGKRAAETETLARQVEEIKQRNADDAELQRKSDYDLCITYLGRVSDCELLRTVREE